MRRLGINLRAIHHSLLVVMMIVGMVLPKTAAVLASFLPGAHVIAICTGDGITYVTINAAGEPVEIEDSRAHHCVMADGAVIASVDIPFWQRLDAQPAPPVHVALNTGADQDRLSMLGEPRAPPVLI